MTDRPNPSLRHKLLAIALVALAVAIWLLLRSNHPRDAASQNAGQAMAKPTADKLAETISSLRSKPAKETARKTLADLRAMLAAMPRDEAIAWIETYLTSGEDQNTGLEFEIGTGNVMTGWPTFRVFLLDALLDLDPAAAARLSRGILAKPTTADEWSLALRNIGRAETGDDTNSYLRERAEALINNPEWQAAPSVGYLNAFDVLVHTRATASTPLLSNLVQMKERRDLAHAAFLTLDRLVQRDPVAELTQLAADTSLHASRPEMTAQQFARADLRDPAQLELVKGWLLDPARTAGELRSFAGVFPNNNRFVSNNLLTEDDRPSGADLAAHDRAVLQIITAWQSDPAFSSRTDTLAEMAARLRSFTNPTPAPGR